MKETTSGVMGTIGRLKKKLSGESRASHSERRRTKRAVLRIPIQVKVAQSEAMSTRLNDISPSGLCFEGSLGSLDDQVWIRFEGYPGVCESFLLSANVARLTSGGPARMAVKINREQTRPEALAEYRKLVLHYLRHKPLLEEKERAFVEVRCATCGWVGRVSVRNRTCSRCGLRVKVLLA